jgi:type I restriction enzyme S subunit
MPQHWAILPNRALFTEVKERNHPDEQMLSVTITKGVMPQKELLEGSSKKDSSNVDKSAYKLVCAGDVAYNKMRAWQGAVGVSDLRGIVSPAYVVVRLRGANCPRYFHYLFRTPHFAKEAERCSYGITSDMWSLRPEHFKMIYCSLPPPKEQAIIVRFLDHADRSVRRFIAAKRKLIELLNEKKQAIIRQAMTRGLDPDIRLKASGVALFDRVPEHWDVGRLDRFITLQRGVDITKEQQVQGPIPVVSSGGISSFHNQFTSRGPGVIVGRKGTVGSVHFLDSDFWAHDTTLWVKEFGDNYPRFVFYLLKVLDLKRFDTGSANPTLNRNVVHPERVAIPPPDEQRAISSFLDEKSQEIDSLVQSMSRQIEFLWEYRTRLVADVVTGKVDVRSVEVNTLDDAGEPESIPGTPNELEQNAELPPVEESVDAD